MPMIIEGSTPEIFSNRISYYVGAENVCEGEAWANWLDGKIAWHPESDAYHLVFFYTYDGETLSLFDGQKFEIGSATPIEDVPDRELKLSRNREGGWLLNGQAMTECR